MKGSSYSEKISSYHLIALPNSIKNQSIWKYGIYNKLTVLTISLILSRMLWVSYIIEPEVSVIVIQPLTKWGR